MNIFNLPVIDYLNFRLNSVQSNLETDGNPEIMVVTMTVLEKLWMHEYWRAQIASRVDEEQNSGSIWADDTQITLSNSAFEVLGNCSMTMTVS